MKGLIRRYSQCLCKAAKDHKHIWDEFIDAAVFAYNTSCHKSTHHTPFEIMFGRKERVVNLMKNGLDLTLSLQN